MLITRAPVRISLAGGGTDLPAYYEQFGGAVISTTIDKYFYAILNVLEKDSIQVMSSDYSTFYRHHKNEPSLMDGDLRLPRAILEHFGIKQGLSMFLASEVPPGTGLGSSSSVTVAIIKAISTALGQNLDKGEVAELACYMEIDKLQEPIGKQDQYAASYGGLNWIEFDRGGVHVEPLDLEPSIVQQLESNLLLFFTDSTRKASKILRKQSESSRQRSPIVIEALHKVKSMAYEVRTCLERGDLSAFGELLHENWEQKKRFAEGISTPEIDRVYKLARQTGAIGGKLTGAGGGGFLMLYCESPFQEAVTVALEEWGFKRMDFRFESLGARILMNSGLSISNPADREGGNARIP